MLAIALEEAMTGLAEGGIPIGAAIFDFEGNLVSRGHNRRVQDNDPSAHAETDAFRRAGRQATWRDKVMVTTLTPCWYCSGLVRQFHFGRVVLGDGVNVKPVAAEGLRALGLDVVDLRSAECIEMFGAWMRATPGLLAEDAGET